MSRVKCEQDERCHRSNVWYPVVHHGLGSVRVPVPIKQYSRMWQAFCDLIEIH